MSEITQPPKTRSSAIHAATPRVTGKNITLFVCNVCPQEMTVKGLEPEIQRLIAKHKAEVKKIKSIHEAELLESDERAGQRYITMTEELRDQLSKEKETACARERELARQT